MSNSRIYIGKLSRDATEKDVEKVLMLHIICYKCFIN